MTKEEYVIRRLEMGQYHTQYSEQYRHDLVKTYAKEYEDLQKNKSF